MEALGITGVEALLLIGSVTGAIQFVKNLWDKDWRSASLIFAAGLIGGLITIFPEIHFSVLTGIIGGLAAPGFIEIAKYIGKKTDGVTIAEAVEVEEKK